MTLALRLYGHFNWPPATNAAPAIEVKSGVLKVYFEAVADCESDALQWLPGTGILLTISTTAIRLMSTVSQSCREAAC